MQGVALFEAIAFYLRTLYYKKQLCANVPFFCINIQYYCIFAYIYAGLGLFLYVYTVIIQSYAVLCGKIEHFSKCAGLRKRLHKQHYDK